MTNVFSQSDVDAVIARINALTPDTRPQWGKMNAAQMLAHCNVTYEMAYENIHKKPNAVVRLILKLFVKEGVVGAKPYSRNSPTAPQFRMTTEKNFEAEKARLIAYLRRTADLGAQHFEGRESLSFGTLSSAEWNTMFGKHLDHHLQQFGV